MDDAARTQLESDVRRSLEAGKADAAATLALKGYGSEIFGFLLAMHRDESEASDVFSIFSENFWVGLPGFAWQCTLRAWAYTLARNASHRHRKRERRHGEGRVPLSQSRSVADLVHRVRTETLTYLRSEHKDRFAVLRESLSEEDQALLVLRVDRRLAWDELARVMSEGDESSDLKREAARLRKRFQLVKEKLRVLGEQAGLFARDD